MIIMTDENYSFSLLLFLFFSFSFFLLFFFFFFLVEKGRKWIVNGQSRSQ